MNDATNMTTPSLTEAFETETCGRCGGSGNYSYCPGYGTRCFKCGGKGRIYSKRGAAALAYGRELRTVPASEVQVGWLLWETSGPLGGRTGWFAVEAIEADGSCAVGKDGVQTPYTCLRTSQMGHGVFAETHLQAVPNKARLREVKALALAYQATLTKTGTVRKKAVAAHVAQ